MLTANMALFLLTFMTDMFQGESAIGIIESMLKKEERKKKEDERKEELIIVHGSKYKDDCSDDYAYLMLSNIILHMEHGR